jgi:beta-phosphoglucomutase-like phosphatase (HAD superfamily)
VQTSVWTVIQESSRSSKLVAHGDYTASKPSPDPFLKAAELLEADPRHCLALEDSLDDIRSASAAGMMAVMVPDILEPTSEIRGLCTMVARDLHEVRDLVLAD